ncbi:MAG: 16S rRNA (cytidine(1402)-2'-O)-methyltransferase [Lachnospiraceae bacterium]|nr:16S rRNA (cytidine(1402)-2'-O)-methyltransferase [Lachnospiraceae bacterium]
MTGKLYVCGTPIGNLSDLSDRQKETLESADLIAAEDTRNSRKILNHLDIKTPMTSYHEHNRAEKGSRLIDKLKEGMNIALVSDAGMPGISDPGQELIAECHREGIPVTVVPGPAALITALVLSGFPSDRFAYEGFLPAEKKERAAVLKELSERTVTTVIYEAPHRLLKTVKELYDALGDRRAAFCKELTKVHEDCSIMTLEEALKYYEEEPPRGEYVIVLGGADPEALKKKETDKWTAMSVEEHMEYYLSAGDDRTMAMKKVAKDRGITKRDVYRELLPDE